MKKCYLMIVFAMLALYVSAQIVYECDFENPSERQQWVLNPQSPNDTTSVGQNRWYIGEAGNRVKGGNGLYVSLQNDNSKPTYLSNTSSSVFAYRELTLTPGNYTLEFDLCCFGMPPYAMFEVFWAPQTLNTYSNNQGTYSKRLLPYLLALDTLASREWRSVRIDFVVENETTAGKLLFVWKTMGQNPAMPPSACIDNIVIANHLPFCKMPSTIQCNEKTGILSWRGEGQWYEIRDYGLFDSTLTVYKNISADSCILNTLSEGMHQVYIRSYCDSTSWSKWKTISVFLVDLNKRCFNYLDIGASTSYSGVCYTGTYENLIRNQLPTMEIVDYGSSDDNSLQTIHTDVNEIDPHTTIDGGLKTVCAGEIASVRIGSRYFGNKTAKSARIEYQYTIQENVSALLYLKCAVVLMSGGHNTEFEKEPSFTVEVLDEQGNFLGNCTNLDIKVGVGGQSNWHQEPPRADFYYWSWCDWITVPVPLYQYVGQTVTIRLTAARCTYETHPCYAYFAITCGGGDNSSVGQFCGDTLVSQFMAPEGFEYAWYVKGDTTETIVSTDRVLNLQPDDDNIYEVTCHNMGADGCSFTLTANPNPYFPEVLVDARNLPVEENIVEFGNRSFARMYSRVDESILATESIRELIYDYGDGSTPELVSDSLVRHTYPKAGGTFRFTAVATSKYACADTLRLDVILPNLQEDTTQVTDTTQVEELPGDTIPLYRYTGDSPDGSTVDPVDPNQVVVTLDDNMLTIRDRSGDEISYTLVNLTVNNIFAKQVLANQTPARYATAEDGMFRNLVVIELTEEGTYLLTLSNPNWEYGIYCTFNYLTDALVPQSAPDVAPTKVLRDGQLLIRQGERMFTPTGMQVGIIVPTDATD